MAALRLAALLGAEVEAGVGSNNCMQLHSRQQRECLCRSSSPLILNRPTLAVEAALPVVAAVLGIGAEAGAGNNNRRSCLQLHLPPLQQYWCSSKPLCLGLDLSRLPVAFPLCSSSSHSSGGRRRLFRWEHVATLRAAWVFTWAEGNWR